MKHPDSHPALLIANKDGTILDFPELKMSGMSNGEYLQPALEDLIPLPEGSELFALPGRLPVGWDAVTNEPVLVNENPYKSDEPVQAVAAFMAPAHTAILTSSFQEQADAPLLPLFAYTAVGWYRDRFWVTGFRSDKDVRQDADQYSSSSVEHQTRKKLKQHKHNRLIQHLGKCCLTYGCPAARNYFLGRWEAPLPSSPSCNAQCLGCISLQPSGCCPSTQDRISFIPTPKEISEMAIAHLNSAENPIVSFGQGCEGEPLLQADTLAEAITLIRNTTDKGTINLNSNSSLPKSVDKLAKSGLDSIRVSLSSAQERYYTKYFRPKNYRFEDVLRSIDIMKNQNRFVSLNYFVLPGFTDSEDEFHALCTLIRDHNPDFIQLRNLNIDPVWYFQSLGFPSNSPALGIRKWYDMLKKEFPLLTFGYFNPQVNIHQ